MTIKKVEAFECSAGKMHATMKDAVSSEVTALLDADVCTDNGQVTTRSLGSRLSHDIALRTALAGILEQLT